MSIYGIIYFMLKQHCYESDGKYVVDYFKVLDSTLFAENDNHWNIGIAIKMEKLSSKWLFIDCCCLVINNSEQEGLVVQV